VRPEFAKHRTHARHIARHICRTHCKKKVPST
jgi:hypothetical protein